MMITDILFRHRDNNKCAMKFANEDITYKELYNRVMEHKDKLDVVPNKANNIAIYLPNSIDYVVAYFIIVFLKKIIVPIEKSISSAMLESVIQYCEIQLIITNSEGYEKLKELLVKKSFLVRIYLLDKGEIKIIGEGDSVKVSESEKECEEDDDVAIMLHTSGTTSNPKKVMLTHRNLMSNVIAHVQSLGLNHYDCTLIVLPMCFGYCNTSQLLAHLYLGAQIVIYKGEFFPRKFIQILQKEKCTNTTCVPSMLMLMAAGKQKKIILPDLKYICFGGGCMAIKQLKMLMDVFPQKGFVQTYGQTEAGPRVTCLLPKDSIRKIGSVGKPIPGVKVKIVNEQGNEAQYGESGEIVVCGNSVMKGYYKQEKITKKTIKDGWLYTGDIGYFDREGFLYLVGRKRNVIISGGLNIYPEEIEEVIQRIPEVKEVVVYPEKHSLLGEVPVAQVVLKKEKAIKAKDVIEFAQIHLETHKVPGKVLFCNSLEKTMTGKIRRKKFYV